MRYSMILSLSLTMLAFHAVGAAALQNEVGTTAAVNQTATGTPPGQAIRTLYVGTDVLFEERISTSKTGLTQILFLDGSSITVGPGSELILDEFIYDPGTGTGKLTLEVVKGTFRLIGGRIGKTNGVSIKTPVATIGIRGSITQGTVTADSTEVTFVAGEQMTVESCSIGRTPEECITRKITRPEFTANVTTDSFSVEKATADEIAVRMVELESTGTQNGGATEIPTADRVATQNIDTGGSALDPVSSRAQTPSPTGTTSATTTDPTTAEELGEQTAASQEAATSGAGVTIPGVYSGWILGAPEDSYFTSSGQLIDDPVAQGFLGGPDEGDESIAGGAIVAGEFRIDQGDAVLHAELPIEIGEFTFTDVVPRPDDPGGGSISGTGYLDPSGAFLFYEVTEDIDGNPGFGFAGIPTPDTVFAAASTFRVDSYELRRDFILDSTIPFLRDDIAGYFPNAKVSDFLIIRPPSGTMAGSDDTEAVWAAMAIEGQGAGQKSLLVGAGGNLEALPSGDVGFDGGLIGSARLDAAERPIILSSSIGTVPDGDGNHFFGDDLDFFVLDPNVVEDVASVDTTIYGAVAERPFDVDTSPAELYGFRHVAMKTDTPAGIGDVRTAGTLRGYASAIVETRLDGDVFPYVYTVATDDVTSGMSITTDPSTNSLTAVFDVFTDLDVVGDTDIDNFRFTFDGIFVDDNLFGAGDSGDTSGFVQREGEAPEVGIDDEFSDLGFRSLLLTHDTAPTDSFLPSDVTFCECDYLTWGYWSSEFRFDDTGGANEDRLERIHMGTFVAGDRSDFADLPTTDGTATYSGHAIGNVYNGGDQYIAVGNFENKFNFATRTGAITITGFDGRDFAGAVDDLGGTGQYAGEIDPTSGISGGLEGSFFAGGGDPAAATAGQFGLLDDATGGGSYSAIGTFAATR